jgi:hypothetical protein
MINCPNSGDKFGGNSGTHVITLFRIAIPSILWNGCLFVAISIYNKQNIKNEKKFILIFTAERPNDHISDRIPYPLGDKFLSIRSGYKKNSSVKKINYSNNTAK